MNVWGETSSGAPGPSVESVVGDGLPYVQGEEVAAQVFRMIEDIDIEPPVTVYTLPFGTPLEAQVIFGTGDGTSTTWKQIHHDEDLNGIGAYTHPELDDFKDAIDAQVDQDVRFNASPSFGILNCETVSSQNLDVTNAEIGTVAYPDAAGVAGKVLLLTANTQAAWGHPALLEFGPAGNDTRLQCRAADVLIDANVLVSDSHSLQLGSTNAPNERCVFILVPGAAAIPRGRFLQIINVGGVGKAAVIGIADPDGTPVIGVSMNTTLAADENVKVCIGGVFSVCVRSGTTINPGNPVEKVDDGDPGRAWAVAVSDGHVGVALTGGTGDAGGTVFIQALFTKSEVF